MRKSKKRVPLPKKPPKVEIPKTVYDRKREKKALQESLKSSVSK
jgi:hypothetical protein